MRAWLLLVVSACSFREGTLPAAPVDASRIDTTDTGGGDAAIDATSIDAAPLMLTSSPGASGDDALQDPNGSMLVAYNWTSLYSTNHWGAIRFALPGVHQGATIVLARLELYIDSTGEDDPNVAITSEATATPAPLASTANNISSRTTGNARVSWVATGIGAGYQLSPMITSVVQERVDDPSWQAGNAILVIFDPAGSQFEYRQWDHTMGMFAARLHVTYVNP